MEHQVFDVAKDRRAAGLLIPLPQWHCRTPGGNSGRPDHFKDGNRLYVALNLSNQLLELEAA
jgi:hypothetical protein